MDSFTVRCSVQNDECESVIISRSELVLVIPSEAKESSVNEE